MSKTPLVVGNNRLIVSEDEPLSAVLSDYSSLPLLKIRIEHSGEAFSREVLSVKDACIERELSFYSQSSRDDAYPIRIRTKDFLRGKAPVFIRRIESDTDFDIPIFHIREKAYHIKRYRLKSSSADAIISDVGENRLLIICTGEASIISEERIHIACGSSAIAFIFAQGRDCVSLASDAFCAEEKAGLCKGDKYAELLLSYQAPSGSFISSFSDPVSDTFASPLIMHSLCRASLFERARLLCDFYLDRFDRFGYILPFYKEGEDRKESPYSFSPEIPLIYAAEAVMIYIRHTADLPKKEVFKRLLKAALCGSSSSLVASTLSFSGSREIKEYGLSPEHILNGSLASTLSFVSLAEWALKEGFLKVRDKVRVRAALSDIYSNLSKRFTKDSESYLSFERLAYIRRPRFISAFCEGCLANSGFENFTVLEMSRNGRYLCSRCASLDMGRALGDRVQERKDSALAYALIANSPLAQLCDATRIEEYLKENNIDTVTLAYLIIAAEKMGADPAAYKKVLSERNISSAREAALLMLVNP